MDPTHSMRRRGRKLRMLSFSGALCAWSLFAHGEARADSYTFDPSTQGKVNFPVWIPERPLASPKEHAELSFAITPIAEDDDLAMTVVFKEDAGAYLGVYWQPKGGQRQLLSADLFENIGLPNQRTLLINRPTLGGPGTLILQSSESVLNVLRVRLDWVRPGVVRLSDNAPNGALINSSGTMFAPEEVDGSPLTAIADTWQGRILTTSITDHAERIEQGVDFPVDIPMKVGRARIEVMVNGLPFSQPLELWLNGKRLGAIALDIPDLGDPGYGSEATRTTFAGWRKGVLMVPANRLIVGENHFQFQGPDKVPVAIRDFLLQVQYSSN